MQLGDSALVLLVFHVIIDALDVLIGLILAISKCFNLFDELFNRVLHNGYSFIRGSHLTDHEGFLGELEHLRAEVLKVAQDFLFATLFILDSSCDVSVLISALENANSSLF